MVSTTVHQKTEPMQVVFTEILIWRIALKGWRTGKAEGGRQGRTEIVIPKSSYHPWGGSLGEGERRTRSGLLEPRSVEKKLQSCGLKLGEGGAGRLVLMSLRGTCRGWF